MESVKDENVYSDTTNLFCETSFKSDSKHVGKLLLDWYVEQANGYLQNRIQKLAKRLHNKPSKIHIRLQNRRWGSCTNKGELILNWKIIMAPPSVIDYVVVHELAHLKEKNHNVAFWGIVANVIPDYKKKKDWLRVNGANLEI